MPNQELSDVLVRIGQNLKGVIDPNSPYIIVIDTDYACARVGRQEIAEKLRGGEVFVPLDQRFVIALRSARQVNGSSMQPLRRLESGIVVTPTLTQESGLPSEEYKPSRIFYLNPTTVFS